MSTTVVSCISTMLAVFADLVSDGVAGPLAARAVVKFVALSS